MTEISLNNLSLEKKINMIFSYIFSDKKNEEEEFFWNNLTENEIINLERIDKNDETMDFSSLKQDLLWK